MTKQEFLAAATTAALESSRISGLPAGITVAQAALESAWGNSQLSREANNYFGIKAHKRLAVGTQGAHAHSEIDDSVAMPTTEVTNGVAARTTARFAKYASMAECFADRDRLILTLPCYAEARANACDPEAFMRALAKHWATDPDYADKLLRTWRSNHLDQLDRQTSNTD